MGLFKKEIKITPNRDAKFEIIAHKRATKKQVEKVKKANETLNDLFVDNNFTVKLVLAAKEH